MAAAVAPGPRGLPIIGSLPGFWRDALGTFLAGFHDHGDVVRFRAGPRMLYLISHPDDIKEILQERPGDFRKSKGIRSKRLLGSGLVTSDGALWMRQRRLIQPLFAKAVLPTFVPIFCKTTEELLVDWESSAGKDTAIDLLPALQKLSLAIVTQALFGLDVRESSGEILEAFSVALEHISSRIFSVVDIPEWVPTPRNLKYVRAIRTLDSFVFGLIRKQDRTGSAKVDLLGQLMAARDEETGAGMSEQQIRDEVMTMVLAGQETTAITLGWTFYLLTRYPDVEARVFTEIERVLGDRAPSVDDLGKLTYLKAVLQESMRLFPPAAVLVRYTKKAETFRGMEIPADAMVILSPFVTHRHPQYWAMPDVFDPERFMTESTDRPRFAYYPFGGGPRQCIGNQFAMLEAAAVLALAVRRYRIRLAPGCQVQIPSRFNLRPHPWILVERREQPRADQRATGQNGSSSAS